MQILPRVAIIAFVVIAITFPTANTQKVLLFEDNIAGSVSVYQEALNEAGLNFTHVHNIGAFLGLLADTWTHVIFAQQDNTWDNWAQPLLNWIAANPSGVVIISNYDGNGGDSIYFLEQMGFEYESAGGGDATCSSCRGII